MGLEVFFPKTVGFVSVNNIMGVFAMCSKISFIWNVVFYHYHVWVNHPKKAEPVYLQLHVSAGIRVQIFFCTKLIKIFSFH